jgi:hypothetical protein
MASTNPNPDETQIWSQVESLKLIEAYKFVDGMAEGIQLFLLYLS